MYKTENKYEHYLNILTPFYSHVFVNFRMCNNHLPIEKHRWSYTNHHERICKICNSGDIGDEYHYLFQCAYLNNLRTKLIPVKYSRNNNLLSYDSLMNENEENVLSKLCKFINIILRYFQQSPGH